MANNILSDAFNLFGRFNAFSRNNNYYTLQSIGDTAPSWIYTTDYWSLYGRIPELQAVVNRRAKMVASGKPYFCDEDGNKILISDLPSELNWLKNLLNRPNPMLSWSKMIEMVEINKCVTGNALIYAPAGTFGNRNIAVPISFNNVKIHANKKGYKQIERSGVIEKFEIPIDNKGTFETLLPNEVVYLFDSDGINLMDTVSRVDALKYPLSNIEKAYEKRNVLLKNVFSLGILTADVGDGLSSQALDDEDIKQQRKDIKNRHKDEIIITDKAFKWQPMSYPTKDLMLYEENHADFVRIIDAFGLNEFMFGNVLAKGTTFANAEAGEKQAYNSTIIPEAAEIYKELTNQWNLDEFGIHMKASFNHVSALQIDDRHKAQADKIEAERLSILLRDGVISTDEYREMIGI